MSKNIIPLTGLQPAVPLERNAPAHGQDALARPAAAVAAPERLAARRPADSGGATLGLRAALRAGPRSGPGRPQVPMGAGRRLLHAATAFLDAAAALAPHPATDPTTPVTPASAGPAARHTVALANAAQRQQLQGVRTWIQNSLATLTAAMPGDRPADAMGQPRPIVAPADDAVRTAALSYVAGVSGHHVRLQVDAAGARGAEAATPSARPSLTQAPAWTSGAA